ncbi:hypothetical protein BH10BAC3_BH10BAC3_42520 [soil metagenome]
MINYFLGDAARISIDFDALKSLSPSFRCLYFGKSEEQLSSVAPYIFRFSDSKEFADHVIENGWGNSWGLFVVTDQPIEEAQHHFRKFLMVKTEGGQQLYFRYYDPRVLRVFLPTCDLEQLKEVFGLLKQFICEDEDPSFALIFSFDGTRLVTERVDAVTLFPSLKKSDIAAALPKVQNENIAGEKTVELNANRPARKFFD